jgi:hypothetical protein
VLTSSDSEVQVIDNSTTVIEALAADIGPGGRKPDDQLQYCPGWSRLQQGCQYIILFFLPRHALLPGDMKLHGIVQQRQTPHTVLSV